MAKKIGRKERLVWQVITLLIGIATAGALISNISDAKNQIIAVGCLIAWSAAITAYVKIWGVDKSTS